MAAFILQGLSSGTLLYVIFFEILERQRACGSRGLQQLASVFVGFLIMLALAFYGKLTFKKNNPKKISIGN